MTGMEFCLAVLDAVKDSGPIAFIALGFFGAVTVCVAVVNTNRQATKRRKFEIQKELEAIRDNKAQKLEDFRVRQRHGD